MAVQAKAKGNGPATGMQKSPPPDQITNVRSPTGQGYGMNGPQNPSSVEPGKRVLSPLAANLESSVDDDGVLAKVLSRPRGALDEGTDDQTRKIDDKGYPAAHGQVSRQANSGSPGGTIPATIGATSAPTVRKPTV
jgi:hypothetical protein